MGANNADFQGGSNRFETGTVGVTSPSTLIPFFDANMRNPEALEKEEGAYQVSLQHHMKEHGFQGEVELRKRKDGSHVIDDGHHRVVAALRLGISAIPYRVLGEGEENKKNSICPTCAEAGHTWLTTTGAM